MSLLIIGMFFFLMGSIATCSVYSVVLLIEVKDEIKKGR